MKQISVVIATYNRPDYIEAGLKCLLLQTYKDFEVVLVDDGSSKDVFSICKNFEDEIDIKYIRQRNVPWNQAVAKNLGIKLSSGKILLLNDDDCFLMPTCLQEHIKIHQQHDKVMVCGEVLLHDKLGPTNVYSYIVNQKYPEGGKVRPFRLLHQNFSVRREYVLAINGYDEDFAGKYGYEDKDFWNRLEWSGVSVLKTNSPKSVAVFGHGHGLVRDRKANFELYNEKLRQHKIVCNNGIEKR